MVGRCQNSFDSLAGDHAVKPIFNRDFSIFFWFTFLLAICALYPGNVQASKIDLLTLDVGRSVKAEIENGLKIGSDGCTEVTELSIDTDTWLMTIAIVLNAHHRWPSIRHPTTNAEYFPEATKTVSATLQYNPKTNSVSGSDSLDVGTLSTTAFGKTYQFDFGTVSILDKAREVIQMNFQPINNVIDKYAAFIPTEDLLKTKAGKMIQDYFEHDLKTIGNQGKNEIVDLRLDTKTYQIKGTAKIIAAHSWGKFNVPDPSITDPFRVKSVEVKKEQEFITTFSYDLKSNRISGEVDLNTGIQLEAKDPITGTELEVIDIPSIKVDINRLERAIDGDIIAMAELIPNPAPSVYRAEKSNKYDEERDEYFDKYGGANVYFSSEPFTEWASAQKLVVWTGQAVVTAGAVSTAIMREIAGQALKEAPGITNWLAGKGVVNAASTVDALLTGRKMDWPFLALELVPVNYKARPVLMDNPVGEWLTVPHLAFAIVWKGSTPGSEGPGASPSCRIPEESQSGVGRSNPSDITVTFSNSFSSETTWKVTSLAETKDNGFILAGIEDTEVKRLDIALFKTDGHGKFQWKKVFQGPLLADNGDSSDSDRAVSVEATDDGGFVFLGTKILGEWRHFDEFPPPEERNTGIWLTKVDSYGNILWNKTYDFGLGIDRGLAFKQTKDRGFIIVGEVEQFIRASGGEPWHNSDYLMIRTDAEGEKLWETRYGDMLENEVATDVLESKEGGFIVFGRDETEDGSQTSGWLIKVDAKGRKLWEKNSRVWGEKNSDVGGAGNLQSIHETSDNGLILAGGTDTWGLWLVKLDNKGDIQWQSVKNSEDYPGGNVVLPDQDVGFIVLEGGLNLVKTDKKGEPVWKKAVIMGPEGENFVSCCLLALKGGGYALAGRYFSRQPDGSTNNDVWLIRIDPEGVAQTQK